jgi:superfamily II RNA helicase
MEGIIEGHHVLACCPTGSGKSLPAEFAIDFFHSKGKKVIYASPIKSLSNQKFNDFTQKYPQVSIGLITGDIKINPDAEVLVMTTEILLNKLYQIKSKHPVTSAVSFDMDIENELACVIFDEIHLINDADRGTVWENSIMMLPRHIQMVGLSATLDEPERFAYWLENRGHTNDTDKVVYLATKKDRAVPLYHYSFIVTNQSIFKTVKDKAKQEEIKKMVNKPIVLQDEKGNFKDETYYSVKKTLELFQTNQVRIKQTHVLNEVSKYLTENEMTPAICYIFSIKKIEEYSREITTNLLEFDSKVPYIARRECEHILRSKLANFQEYLVLPEYVTLVSLLEKGVATHHSKMLPIFREIVEIFFAKGYIKLLFATESVAIGLNLPVRTCIFTDVYKHDGNQLRMLHGHEYAQSSGRAGRLGLDKVGHVIHLNNLFRSVDYTSYRTMMNGKPQKLVSKFKISYNLLLNLLDGGNEDLLSFVNRSITSGDIDVQLKLNRAKLTDLRREMDNANTCLDNCSTPRQTMVDLLELQHNSQLFSNKKKKEAERTIKDLYETHRTLKQDLDTYRHMLRKQEEVTLLEEENENVERRLQQGIQKVLDILVTEGHLVREEQSLSLSLTQKGRICSQLKEVNCLVFSDFIENNTFGHFTSRQLVSFFSCFTNVHVREELKDNSPKIDDNTLIEQVSNAIDTVNKYLFMEQDNGLDTGLDYTLHYDLMAYVDEWTYVDDEQGCKFILQKVGREKEIFLGEFVKALLKINNISTEMEKVAEMTGNMELLSKLREIPGLTLKYVATNQSLYI